MEKGLPGGLPTAARWEAGGLQSAHLFPRNRRIGGTDQLKPRRLRVRLINHERYEWPARHGRAHRRKQRRPRKFLIELGRLRRRQRDLPKEEGRVMLEPEKKPGQW